MMTGSRLRPALHRLPVLFFLVIIFVSCSNPEKDNPSAEDVYNPDARPYIRWWWFADVIRENDIAHQLDWVKANGFGGVEVAFVYPVNRNPEADRTPWLSDEWTDRVTFTKQYADSIGLGCDFTFGTLWPFGGTFVADSDATKIFGDSSFRQPLYLSWTHPDTGNVIDHMDPAAFERYASVMTGALQPALEGRKSALFCDSWEVETRFIWTDGFGKVFQDRYGYQIEPFMSSIYKEGFAEERYDYMKLVSEFVINGFYAPFAHTCRELNAWSRVQCAGSPTDLISAYALIDIPETEAMLYNPDFSRIVASAAALANRNVVSAESFTCLYGWPTAYHSEENVGDLKLVADALFANGVNQIVWHGMPYNPENVDSFHFYATVHVGKKGALSPHLNIFNEYLTHVSYWLRQGRAYGDVAVYLPQEDAWVAGELPDSLKMPWSWGRYELRYIEYPEEMEGYHPLWINGEFLEKGRIVGKKLVVNDLELNALFIDVNYLDETSLSTVFDFAQKGLPVCIAHKPVQPGKNKSIAYHDFVDSLFMLPNVSGNLAEVYSRKPLLRGPELPAWWCRELEDGKIFFFANPFAKNLRYPLQHGQSYQPGPLKRKISIQSAHYSLDTVLVFQPGESILWKINDNGRIMDLTHSYLPSQRDK